MGVEEVQYGSANRFSWRHHWPVVLFWTVAIGAFVWGLAR